MTSRTSKEGVYASLDPVWAAMSKLRRRRYGASIDMCTEILKKNPRDKVSHYKKIRIAHNIARNENRFV